MAGKAVRCIVISGHGTNCEMETAHGCRMGGAEVADIVHISRLIHGEVCLEDYHLLCLAGGFLDGDDLGAAQAGANRIRHARVASTGERLFDHFMRFIEAGKLILGICNGFQIMVKLGLLPALDGRYGQRDVTITFNDSGRFEDRWVYMRVEQSSPSVFTRDLKKLYLPVRHGEGKFFPRDDEVMRVIEDRHLVSLRYCDRNYRSPTMSYPENPNGSIRAVAGISDESGRLMGLMPHPEAYLYFTNHPRWTRGEAEEEGMGVAIFRNAVNYIRKNLL
ncbi:MAG: phosphoribosylformylglycinamidine synthase subunit PurQ [Deltaproteobacteria bacterium]|nr:phosphoribosylformylglycinamidine synthase subunit PurQ [Deltaproteobacteria bacterium]